MIETKCALGSCKKPLKIAENREESLKGDSFEVLVFSYATFFFCSRQHIEEYVE